jgi:glycolate dehydrogenase FAD-binding subunit
VSGLRIAAQSEDGVADVIRQAAETGKSLEIVSSGALRNFGRPVASDAILDVSAISGVVKYEPEELVLTARAGTPLTEIEAILAGENQMLGFEPADWAPLFGEARAKVTLAGIVATNGSGARRVKAGAVRDHLIGCRFINGRGEMIKAGGRVIKNVTGFDLPKLMCGAFGTLGVLTELTMRVTPAPKRIATLALKNCDAAAGLRALSEAGGLAVDPTGLAYLPSEARVRSSASELGASGVALIRIEGNSPAVVEKLDVLLAQFKHHDVAILDDDRTAVIFREISSGGVFVNRTGDIWRLCVSPSQAYESVQLSGASFWYADWAGGLIWLELPASAETAARLRAITGRFGGHATLMRASSEVRARLAVFEPEPPARAKLTAAVKAAFDPQRILNRDRMYENI